MEMDSRSFQVSKAPTNNDECTDIIVLPMSAKQRDWSFGVGSRWAGLRIGSWGGTMKGRCAEADSSDPLLVTENENPPIIHITAPGWWIPEPQQGLLQEDGLCL